MNLFLQFSYGCVLSICPTVVSYLFVLRIFLWICSIKSHIDLFNCLVPLISRVKFPIDFVCIFGSVICPIDMFTHLY